MELFERVEAVLKIKGHSRHSLAKRLGIAQVTFNRYFNKENQDKLSAHLWALLEVYPDVRRDWLFFDEGQPFDDPPPSETQAAQAPPLVDIADMTAELATLRAELVEERRMNRKLVTRLLIDGVGDKGVPTNIAKAADGAE